MKRGIKRWWRLRSLSVRLFLWLSLSIIIVFLTYAWLVARTTSRSWNDTLQRTAEHTTESIKQATYYGMLLNRKEEVHHTIRRIAKSPGVMGIRIYDKRGSIMFSSDEKEIGQRVNREADGCAICHEPAEPLRSVPAASRARIYTDDAGQRVLGLIHPIDNERACSSAPCHAHRADQTILGVLDVRLSMASADASLSELERQTLVYTGILALVVGVISGGFIFRMVRRPVRRLIEGTQRIAAGDLKSRVPTGPDDELGDLGKAFNIMTDKLEQARSEIEHWSRRLEQKVVQKTDELSLAQKQIIHMEKMASLGKLAATVAHELNNPIAGILNYAKLVDRELGELPLDGPSQQELKRYVTMIQKESSRCGDIVRNMLLSTRRSGSELRSCELAVIMDRAIMLVQHRLQMVGVELDYQPVEGDDTIFCDCDQVQQAVLAMLVNAVEAMPDGGKLTVITELDDGWLIISIRDTGVGIAPEALPHLFEPFYSTKEHGSGVGLGLSVAYGIVQRHGGSIEVTSEVGQGAHFQIRMPRHAKQLIDPDTAQAELPAA